MKKAILMFAVMGIAYHGMAQDKFVVTALTALNSKNYEEAKDAIDKAMASPETKEKPKALFAKAAVYSAIQDDEKYKATAPYKEALQALFKLNEVKPDYEKANVDQMLLRNGFIAYNEGAKAYNDKKYAESAELMKSVVKIHDLGGGKRFEKNPFAKTMDTIAADADLSIANSAYYSNNYAEAIPLLQKVKKQGIRMSTSVYECLIAAYNGQKDNVNELATIEEARKAYPTDVTLRNYELNYYIKAGKTDELVKKLEDAARAEPNNSDIQFNIATTYLDMASKKPANAAELVAKSENAFQAAIKIAPDNAAYNHNFGALYFNQATEINDQMNALGTTAAETKKYDELKAKRDAIFGKALPYLEKSYSILSAQGTDQKGGDQKTYKQTVQALSIIYARQSKLDKAQEMTKKLESLK
jgi:hypothetical protein